MKISRYITAAAVAAALAAPLSAPALTHVLIAGDRSCAGSADSTLFMVNDNNKNVAGAYTYASGLYLTPGTSPDANTVGYQTRTDDVNGAQTMVEGLHAVLRPAIDDDIVYAILSIDKPIAEWSAADLRDIGAQPDYVVWMHGGLDAEKGTTADNYYTGLKNVLGALGDATRLVMVQPANSGRVHAARPLDNEYDLPSIAIESAIVRYATERGATVTPSYMCEFGSDGRTPRSASMRILGETVAKAALGGPVGLEITAVDPFGITIKPAGGRFGYSIEFAMPLPAEGFEVWRTTGGRPRRLAITDIRQDGDAIHITTREQLAEGDILRYGATEHGVGRSNGCRGNITVAGRPVAVFDTTIGTVSTASANITGRITCDGQGVPGVVVSDGYALATTDRNGCYALNSNKRLGYVFYSLPSGYEPETEENGWQVKIHSSLTSADILDKEVHDFTLRKADNRKYMLVVGADAHIAARNQDKSQFKAGFIRSVKDLRAANPDARIYSTILGDMSWDQYWYANNYALPDFVNSLTTYGYPFMLFPVTGNHDNDGATPAGADCDLKASAAFRSVMAPTYYSYNLGDVHYVVLDDIIYKNTFTAGKTYSTGIVGDRDYGRYYTDEQLEWLRRDLETIVDKTTPIIVCFHIQNWALSTNGAFTVSANLENSASDRLAEILKDFSEVHMLSGHTHYNFHAHPAKYPNIHENNVAGICATWWWTGKLVGRHICKDGSPGGYAVYTVDGRDISWKYRSSEDNTEPQMRIYDMNAVKAAYKTDEDIKTWLAYDKTQTNYANVSDNLVYINVFNYDTDWKVEVFEGDESLTAKRITAQDPLHVICYEVPRYKAAKTVTADFVTNKTNHMFSVQTTTADKPVTVRLTDSFGNVYTQTLVRPGRYAVDM